MNCGVFAHLVKLIWAGVIAVKWTNGLFAMWKQNGRTAEFYDNRYSPEYPRIWTVTHCSSGSEVIKKPSHLTFCGRSFAVSGWLTSSTHRHRQTVSIYPGDALRASWQYSTSLVIFHCSICLGLLCCWMIKLSSNRSWYIWLNQHTGRSYTPRNSAFCFSTSEILSKWQCVVSIRSHTILSHNRTRWGGGFGTWAVPSIIWTVLIFASSVHRTLFQDSAGFFMCVSVNCSLAPLFLRFAFCGHEVFSWSLTRKHVRLHPGECSWLAVQSLGVFFTMQMLKKRLMLLGLPAHLPFSSFPVNNCFFRTVDFWQTNYLWYLIIDFFWASLFSLLAWSPLYSLFWQTTPSQSKWQFSTLSQLWAMCKLLCA